MSVLAAEDCDMFWHHNDEEACDGVFRRAGTFGMLVHFPMCTHQEEGMLIVDSVLNLVQPICKQNNSFLYYKQGRNY